jgi:hypothetical protein
MPSTGPVAVAPELEQLHYTLLTGLLLPSKKPRIEGDLQEIDALGPFRGLFQ